LLHNVPETAGYHLDVFGSKDGVFFDSDEALTRQLEVHCNAANKKKLQTGTSSQITLK